MLGWLQWEIIPVTLNSFTTYSPNALLFLSLLLGLLSRMISCDYIDMSSYI